MTTPERDVAAIRERLARALGSLTVDEIDYDHPVAMSGEPMDPVLFVEYAAFRRALLDAAPLSSPVEPPPGLDRLTRIEAAARRLLALIDEPMTPRNRRMDAQAALREALLPTQASDSPEPE